MSKISQLPVTNTPSDSDLVLIVQSGATKAIPFGDLVSKHIVASNSSTTSSFNITTSSITSSVAAVSSTVAAVSSTVVAVSSTVASVSSTVASVSSDVAAVSLRVAAVSSTVASVSSNVMAVSSAQVGILAAVASMSSTVAGIGTIALGVSSNLASLSSTVASLGTGGGGGGTSNLVANVLPMTDFYEYALQASDANGRIISPVTSYNYIRVPSDDSLNFATGTVITIAAGDDFAAISTVDDGIVKIYLSGKLDPTDVPIWIENSFDSVEVKPRTISSLVKVRDNEWIITSASLTEFFC